MAASQAMKKNKDKKTTYTHPGVTEEPIDTPDLATVGVHSIHYRGKPLLILAV